VIVDESPQDDDGWSVAHIEELVGLLVGFRDFHGPGFFQQVLLHMGKHLNREKIPFAVPYYADVRSQLAALADCIYSHRDPAAARRALADTLHFLRPDEKATVRLQRFVDKLAPEGKLPGPQLRAVVDQLDAMKNPVPVTVADEALRMALLPGEPTALRGSETVSDMVRRLSDARDNAAVRTDPTTRGPLVLRFLSELAGTLPDTEQRVLRRQVSMAVRELGLPSQVDADLAARGRQPAAQGGHRVASQGGSRVLQIRLRETTPGRQKYTVDAAVYDWTADGLCRPRKREAPQSFSPGELERFGRTCLADWSDLATRLDDADRVRVEFLLPWSLLGHPVEHWLADGLEYPLGHKYPVVVRSLDRLERPSWRRDWKRRWRELHHAAPAQPGAGVAWLALDTTAQSELDGEVLHVRGHDGEVRAWLDTCPQTTALGLGLAFAYDATIPKRALGLQEAVREGVPLILWRRDNGDPGELARKVGRTTTDRCSELIDDLRLWRRAADKDNTGDMRHHLTLLWDDPECVPHETALTAPIRDP
jgi:hypothetical protein